MTRGQTTCSLGGTASLGLLFALFHSYNFYCRFPENDCSFDGLLTLLRESGRHSKSSVKAVAIFLFLAIKSRCATFVNTTNYSDATFRLLVSGDINPNPGPVSASTAGKIKCLVMNATKTAQRSNKPCVTSIASRTWCTPKTDFICVNETWLNQNISNSEVLHSGFTIFRRDRSDRGCGLVLIAIKTSSFKAVKEFKPESEAELQQLRNYYAYWSKNFILFLLYGPLKEDPSWMDVFNNFLHEVCDQFDNMVILGDFNLPDIL